MYYQQFSKSLNVSFDIVESIRSYGNLVQKTADDEILLNNELTDFKTIEEARTYIKTKQTSDTLEESIQR